MQKGITPLISILLILVIAIATISIALVYFSGILTTSGGASVGSAEHMSEQLTVQFRIENINQDNVTIRNMGASEITNISFYVDGIRVNYTGTLPIPKNGIEMFTLDLSEISEPVRLKAIAGIIKHEANMIFYLTDKDVCQTAEDWGICDGLNIAYGEGYKEKCCSEHGLCCS